MKPYLYLNILCVPPLTSRQSNGQKSVTTPDIREINCQSANEAVFPALTNTKASVWTRTSHWALQASAYVGVFGPRSWRVPRRWTENGVGSIHASRGCVASSKYHVAVLPRELKWPRCHTLHPRGSYVLSYLWPP